MVLARAELGKCFHDADIAAKLGHKDVCDITPTEIAFEVSLSLSCTRTKK